MQILFETYSPFGLNTVPSPKDSGVTPSVITHSATAVEAAKLVKTSFNKLKAKHPKISWWEVDWGKPHWTTQRLPDPTRVKIWLN